MMLFNAMGHHVARQLIDRAVDYAKNDGLEPVAFCVVDASGQQICAERMDGVKSPSVNTAYSKAVTAVLYSHDTSNFRWKIDFETGIWTLAGDAGWSDHDIANEMKIQPIFCSWGGGRILTEDNIGSGGSKTAVIGGFAASGRSEQEDHELVSQAMSWLMEQNT